ncbi:MAG: TIGR00725 family protein, partial [Thermoplasmatales archaeon]
MKKLISICGSDVSDENLSRHALDIAYIVGRLVAKKDGVIICGGHGGVMEAVCRGAKEEGGITVGIMPFDNKEANDYIDIAIPTNIGNVRNFLVSRAGDVTIAIGGRWGTLNEISFRMITGKP